MRHLLWLNFKHGITWGARKLTLENLKLVWAKFSTLRPFVAVVVVDDVDDDVVVVVAVAILSLGSMS